MKAVAKQGRVLIKAQHDIVRDRKAEAEAAVVAYNEAATAAHKTLIDALRAYDEAVEEYNGTIDDEIAALDDFVRPKGARWRDEHESDYDLWRQALDEGKAEEAEHPDDPTIDVVLTIPDDLPPLSLDEAIDG